MADEKNDKGQAAEAAPKKKGKMKLLMIIGGIMAVEGVGVFYVANMLGGSPPSAEAAEGEESADESSDHGKSESAGHDGKADDGHGDAKSAEKPSKSDGHGEKKESDHGSAKSDGHSAKADDHGAKSDSHGEKKSAEHGAGDSPAGSDTEAAPVPSDGLAEIEFADVRLHNSRSGRMMLVRIRVSALVSHNEGERIKSLVTAKKSRIYDRVSMVVRNADPKFLNEPGLDTLKRQLRHELGQVLGDTQIIKEVLIPELLQS